MRSAFRQVSSALLVLNYSQPPSTALHASRTSVRMTLTTNLGNQADTENPYKLTIVDSVDPSSENFYTLSMNGLVWSTRDRTEFVTVEQFERQYM